MRSGSARRWPRPVSGPGPGCGCGVIGPGVAAECVVAADGLHVNEDHFVVEAVDPATGRPVPDGTPGELVFSTVTKEALPLLRYRTGDIAALRRGTCACGRT